MRSSVASTLKKIREDMEGSLSGTPEILQAHALLGKDLQGLSQQEVSSKARAQSALEVLGATEAGLEQQIKGVSALRGPEQRLLDTAIFEISSSTSPALPESITLADPSLASIQDRVRSAAASLSALDGDLAALDAPVAAHMNALEVGGQMARMESILDMPENADLVPLVESSVAGDGSAMAALGLRSPDLAALLGPVYTAAAPSFELRKDLQGKRQAGLAWWGDAAGRILSRLNGLKDRSRQAETQSLKPLHDGLEQLASERRRIESSLAGELKSLSQQRDGLEKRISLVQEELDNGVSYRKRLDARMAVLLAREAEYEAALSSFEASPPSYEELMSSLSDNPYVEPGQVSGAYQACVERLLDRVGERAEVSGQRAAVSWREFPWEQRSHGTLWRGHSSPSPYSSPKGMLLGGAITTPEPCCAYPYITNQGSGHPFMPAGTGFMTRFDTFVGAEAHGANVWVEDESTRAPLGEDVETWPAEILATPEVAVMSNIFLVKGMPVGRTDEVRLRGTETLQSLGPAGLEDPALVRLQQAMDRETIARSLAAKSGEEPTAAHWEEASRALAGQGHVSTKSLAKVLWDDRSLTIMDKSRAAASSSFLRCARRGASPEVNSMHGLAASTVGPPPEHALTVRAGKRAASGAPVSPEQPSLPRRAPSQVGKAAAGRRM